MGETKNTLGDEVRIDRATWVGIQCIAAALIGVLLGSAVIVVLL